MILAGDIGGANMRLAVFEGSAGRLTLAMELVAQGRRVVCGGPAAFQTEGAVLFAGSAEKSILQGRLTQRVTGDSAANPY